MTQNTELFTPASAWTSIPLIQRDIEHWTSAQRDAFLQMLLNRVEYAKDKAAADLLALCGDGTRVKMTDEGGLAVLATNRSGGALAAGEVVEPYMGWDVTDSAAEITAVDNVAGASATNTDAGKLYLEVGLPGGNATVTAYSDSDRTVAVAEGALVGNGGGVVSLAAVGGSGLTLDATIVAGASAGITASALMGSLRGVTKAVTNSIEACGVVYEAAADGADVWIVVAGEAQVKVAANVPFGAWLITSATTAGGVDILYAADATKVQRGVGRSIGRRAGVGTTVGARLDLGRTWGV